MPKIPRSKEEAASSVRQARLSLHLIGRQGFSDLDSGAGVPVGPTKSASAAVLGRLFELMLGGKENCEGRLQQTTVG